MIYACVETIAEVIQMEALAAFALEVKPHGMGVRNSASIYLI